MGWGACGGWGWGTGVGALGEGWAGLGVRGGEDGAWERGSGVEMGSRSIRKRREQPGPPPLGQRPACDSWPQSPDETDTYVIVQYGRPCGPPGKGGLHFCQLLWTCPPFQGPTCGPRLLVPCLCVLNPGIVRAVL